MHNDEPTAQRQRPLSEGWEPYTACRSTKGPCQDELIRFGALSAPIRRCQRPLPLYGSATTN
jgi:hypothetical protein